MFAAETKLSGRSGASRSGPVRENDAKNSQLLEDAVGARKELCEQCALPAPRQSGENSGLENNLEAPDPTESHPVSAACQCARLCRSSRRFWQQLPCMKQTLLTRMTFLFECVSYVMLQHYTWHYNFVTRTTT